MENKADVNTFKSWTLKSKLLSDGSRILTLGDTRKYDIKLTVDGREVDLKTGPIFLNPIEDRIAYLENNGYTDSVERFKRMESDGVSHVATVKFVEK